MATDAVYPAIKTYILAQLAGLADADNYVGPTVRWENEAFTRPTPLPNEKPRLWFAVAISGVVYGQQSLGATNQADNRWDEEGTLWLSVFAPADSGAAAPRLLAKRLADLFRGVRLLADSLEFRDAYFTQGGPGDEDGAWYQIPVAIDWRRMNA